jgi:Pathogenicity locus
MKAKNAKEAITLDQIPNIGKAVIEDLRLLGITKPGQLKNKDGIKLYKKLNKLTGVTHDPCMADTLMAAVDFMNGGKARPWWDFTAERKKILSQ